MMYRRLPESSHHQSRRRNYPSVERLCITCRSILFYIIFGFERSRCIVSLCLSHVKWGSAMALLPEENREKKNGRKSEFLFCFDTFMCVCGFKKRNRANDTQINHVN